MRRESWQFHVEAWQDSKWRMPEEFMPTKENFDLPLAFAERYQFCHPWIFRGNAAVLPFRQGWPPETADPASLRQLMNARNCRWEYKSEHDWEIDYDVMWLPYEEVCVDLWPDKGTLLLGAQVPARLAPLFGEGKDMFPYAALNLVDDENTHGEGLFSFCRGVENPVDSRPFFSLARRIDEFPEAKVEVTWRSSIVELLGEQLHHDFLELRRFGRDSDLRILTSVYVD